MSNKGKKLADLKFGLDMPFAEALERAIQTVPVEVDASIKRSKKTKPPGGKKRKPPGTADQSGIVVDLRRRRMRRRNEGR